MSYGKQKLMQVIDDALETMELAGMHKEISYQRLKEVADGNCEDDERARFEAWISAPPFKLEIDRYPNDPEQYYRPGSYQIDKVDFAWQVWQAALEA